MKSLYLTAACTVLSLSLTPAFASEQKAGPATVTAGNAKKAHAIIDKKCTTCHTKEKIDMALSAGKDMNAIQRQMEKKGVRLNSKEQEVLGIFWKESRPISK